MVINPTFDSTITSDPNAASIESTINSVIAIYESTFSNPIVVPITFAECGGGCLGESSFLLHDISYEAYSTALFNNAQATQNADQLAASAANPISTTNPVTGTTDILAKCATVDELFGQGSSGCASDGTISLGTNITTPGSPGTSDTFSLMATAEHEIDEILALGSTLGLGLGGDSCLSGPCSDVPSGEDLFRYDAARNRSFTENGSAKAFFSINGSVDLAQFDNQNDGGDFGDWQSSPLPPGVAPQVQDAFATPGSNPTLGPNELTALNVLGYNFTASSVTPEPGTIALMAGGLFCLAGFARRRNRG